MSAIALRQVRLVVETSTSRNVGLPDRAIGWPCGGLITESKQAAKAFDFTPFERRSA